MPGIGDYIPRREPFKPEIASAMGKAYNRAIESLDTRLTASVKQIVAKRILRLAQNGERDARVLCAEALATLGDQSVCDTANRA